MANGNPDVYVATVFSFGERGSINAGLMRFLAGPGGSNLGSELAIVVPRAGTLRSLRWSAAASGLTGAGHRLTVMCDGVATALIATWDGMVAAGANLVDEVPVAAGQRIALQVQAAAGGTSITRLRASVELVIESESLWISDGPNVYFDGGDVGIGTTAPGERLTVEGIVESTQGGFKFPDGTLQVTAAAGGGGFALQAFDGTPAQAVYVDADGLVGVGTTTPTARLTLAAGATIAVDLPIPDSVQVTPEGGGALSDGAACYFRVVATDGVRLSAGSQEVEFHATTAQNLARVSWHPVLGARAYRVYKGSVSGAPNLWRSTTETALGWATDIGAAPVKPEDWIPPRTEAYVTRLSGTGDSWLLGGRLGIGTATPDAALEVSGDACVRGRGDDVRRGLAVLDHNSGQAVLVPTSGGVPALPATYAQVGYNFYGAGQDELRYRGGHNAASGIAFGAGIQLWTAAGGAEGEVITPRPCLNVTSGGDLEVKRGGIYFGHVGDPNYYLRTYAFPGSAGVEVRGYGEVKLTTAAGSLRVSTDGTVFATGFVEESDARHKTVEGEVNDALAAVRALRGVRYRWADGRDRRVHLGLLAQEVQAVLPELVIDDGAGSEYLDYRALVVPVLEAVKELADMVDSLRAEVRARGNA